jgi:hypothetical protein
MFGAEDDNPNVTQAAEYLKVPFTTVYSRFKGLCKSSPSLGASRQLGFGGTGISLTKEPASETQSNKAVNIRRSANLTLMAILQTMCADRSNFKFEFVFPRAAYNPEGSASTTILATPTSRFCILCFGLH